MFAHIARKEEFDLFLSLTKLMKGSAYAMAAAPPIILDLVGRLSQRACEYVHDGIFREDEDKKPLTTSTN